MGRDNHYDLLKIICAVEIIMIHVSAAWFVDAIDMAAEYGVNINEI